MKNNKGFTLVELLVVIVIFGIIMGLSFPAIRRIQENNTNTKYETYQKALISGAKLYVDSFEEDLFGNKTSGCAYLPFEKLKEKELAKDIGINDVSCNTENTFVKVVKFQGKFMYKAYLGCGTKNESGTINDVSIVYPSSDTPYEIDPNLCKGVDAISNISIYASPTRGMFYRNYYNVRITVQSISGINKNAKIYYSWTHSNNPSSITELTEFNFDFPDNQSDIIETGNLITSTSEVIEMPENADGIYYLIIKAENLYDLSGEAWIGPDGDKNYIKFGPYYIDNQAPTFSGTTIVSNSSDYNTINPILNLNINDNHTTKDAIKICVSVDSNDCGIDNYYYNTSEIPIPQIDKYTGNNHEIYINAIDEANNKSETKINYTVPKGYAIYYDTFGGTECETKYVLADTNSKAKLGELCTPTKSGKKFKGWYDNNKKVNKNTKIDNDILLRAEWS